MRRILGLPAALGLLSAIFPVMVAAGEPTRASSVQTFLGCEFSTDAGHVGLSVQNGDSEALAELAIWGPGADPFSDPPTVVTVASTALLDGSSLIASFELADAEGPQQAAGSAQIEAELTPVGPEQDFGSGLGRDGNRLVRIEQTLQLLAVDGSLTLDLLDGVHDEVDLATCGASTLSSTFFGTNPNAYLTSGDQLFISCEWTTAGGAISLLAIHDEFGAFSELTIVRGEVVLVGITVPFLSETTYQAQYELFDPAGGAEAVGIVTADAVLSPSGDRITDRELVGPFRLSTVGERLAVDGTLTVRLGGTNQSLPMDDPSCRAGDVRVQVMEKIPRAWRAKSP